MIGAPLARREDPELVRGAGIFLDDLTRPGLLHMAVVRSPHAHARLDRIATEAARRRPGVVAVFTAADLAGRCHPEPAVGIPPGTRRPPRPLLAADVVRYAGEPVAAVVAEDRYAARDACDAVETAWTPLPAVVDPVAALAPGAPRVHETFPDNVALRWEWQDGDVEGAFAAAAHVVRLRLEHPRLAVVALEPRGCLAEYRGETLTVWAATQTPHRLRRGLARILGLPEAAVRVITPRVGGGFGGKIGFYADEALCAWAARHLGRPVKLHLTRTEDFLATTQGRGQVNEVEAAVAADGRVLALRCRTIADLGAYLEAKTPQPGLTTGRLITGPYRIPAASYELTAVFTNKMATAPYRGAGRPEATYLLERTMDAVARVCDLDPVVVRRRNLVPADAFPHKAPSGLVYDSGRYQAALDRALALVGYDDLRALQRRGWREGRYLGIGLATFVETAGVGPARFSGDPGWESATVRVDPSGSVRVLTGASPHGQGIETAFAQIAAARLGVPVDAVEVLYGDTAVVADGVGTFGSRSVAVGGSAVAAAINELIERGRPVAARLLEAAAADLVWEPGRFRVRGVPDRAVTIGEVARAAGGLEAALRWDPPNFTFPSGTHVAVVEVDPETGEVRLLRFVAVDDCGTIVNPVLVEGQIHGGLAQGIGPALWEAVVHDESGQPLAATLMEYAIARAGSLPAFELDQIETRSPVNPLGAKGVGEAGTIGSTAAVVNAVLDALRPLGVTHLDMPLTPARIWAAIVRARGAGRRGPGGPGCA